MSYHVVCHDGFIRRCNNGPEYDHGWPDARTAERRAHLANERCDCSKSLHRVEQGIRLPAASEAKE